MESSNVKPKRSVFLCLGLVFAPSILTIAAEPPEREPMLISLAWSSPDTRYLRDHVARWEMRPFSGTVLCFSSPHHPRGRVNASTSRDNGSWHVFFKTRIPQADIENAIRDLQATRFTTSRDNFLEVVSWLPDRQHFDWFDDVWWQAVLHNIEQVARVAKEGGCRGILLDMEEYGCPFWSWGGSRPHFALKNKDTYRDRTFRQTFDQCRQRGREFLRALNKGFPDCPIWTLYGYSHIVNGDDVKSVEQYPESGNALYAAFFDGWLEGSDAGTYFIDGCEGSYRFDHTGIFKDLRRIVTDKALSFTTVPELYRKKVRVGFGIYLDMYNYADSHPWHPDRPQDNYMTPERLEKVVRIALNVSDGYVWVYGEYPSWWLDGPEDTFGEGVVSRPDHGWIDRAYWEAIDRAKAFDVQRARLAGAANAAYRKPVNGRDDLFLTDGDVNSRTPQTSHAFDYTVDLQGEFRISHVELQWDVFGSDPQSIQQWQLYATHADGSTVPLAGGQCPGNTQTKVLVNRDGLTKLRVTASSTSNWIAMTELAAFVAEPGP